MEVVGLFPWEEVREVVSAEEGALRMYLFLLLVVDISFALLLSLSLVLFLLGGMERRRSGDL